MGLPHTYLFHGDVTLAHSYCAEAINAIYSSNRIAASQIHLANIQHNYFVPDIFFHVHTNESTKRILATRNIILDEWITKTIRLISTHSHMKQEPKCYGIWFKLDSTKWNAKHPMSSSCLHQLVQKLLLFLSCFVMPIRSMPVTRCVAHWNIPINIVGVYTNIFTMVTNPNNLGKNFKKKSLAHLEGCRNKNNYSSPGVDLMKSFALVKCTLTGQGQQHKTANSSTRI